MELTLGVFAIFIGLFLFYIRYRSIIGGTLCEAKVIRCDIAHGGRLLAYNLIVKFDYKGKRLQLPVSLRNTFAPRRQIGREFLVYYNERYPDFVTSKRSLSDIYWLGMIAAGLILIFGAFQ